MEISLSPRIVLQCYAFALKCAETNLIEYTRRGQANIEKIIEDILVGKLGEFAVYKYLSEKGNLEEPDLEIYGSRQKSFSPDLKFNDFNVHVKTQSTLSAGKYGNSWILHHNDPLIRKALPNDYIALCTESETGIFINSILPISTILERGLLEEPRLKWFQKIKKAIYWSSLKTACRKRYFI